MPLRARFKEEEDEEEGREPSLSAGALACFGIVYGTGSVTFWPLLHWPSLHGAAAGAAEGVR